MTNMRITLSEAGVTHAEADLIYSRRFKGLTFFTSEAG